MPESLAQNGAQDDFTGGLRIRLACHIGPGSVQIVADAGGIVADSADGLDLLDSFSIIDSPFIGDLIFSEMGIHWLEFEVEGLSGGSVAATSGRLRVRCGANVGADHDYATWSDSYERATGLATGSLSDPSADMEGDGLVNELELFLEAAGAHPLRCDKAGDFVLEVDPFHAGLVFLRDLYKDSLDTDPLDQVTPQLRASASEDY